MTALLEMAIQALLPVLLQIAESAMGVKPDANDSNWVAGLIKEVVVLVNKYIPSWLLPEMDELEHFIAAEIEKLLGKVESKLE